MTRSWWLLVAMTAACSPGTEVAPHRGTGPEAATASATPSASEASTAAVPAAVRDDAAGASSASATAARLAPLPGFVVQLDPVSGPCAPAAGTDAALEARVAKHDACAAAALAERIVAHRALPDAYARAMTLFTAALDAGVSVSCWPFESSDDRARLARCLQKRGDRAGFAVLLAFGDGVPRDLDKARALASAIHDESCDGSMLTEQLDKAASLPAGRAPRLCELLACTTLAMNACAAELEAVDGFESSALRGRAVAQMSDAERARHAPLRAAAEAYRHAESERVYWMHSGGTMRNLLASGRASVLDHEVDATVARVFGGEPFAPASEADLAALGREVAKQERAAVAEGIPGLVLDPSFQVEYRAAVTSSVGAYARYERAMLELARDRLDAPAERALRAELRRARLEGLKDDL